LERNERNSKPDGAKKVTKRMWPEFEVKKAGKRTLFCNHVQKRISKSVVDHENKKAV